MVINEPTYVDQAEGVIKKLSMNKDNRGNTKWITTSKIRNLLAMTVDIYNEILTMDEKLPEDVCARIDYLRVRFIYESGRDGLVKSFVETAQLIEALKEIEGSRNRFIQFNRYLEALVAYHRYYGGKD
ncbi:MAG: type III-A CRISPR-associated protein Csm2 [Lachnospiraceae bacterium]|nr:type III-A CRISPR-associated protein Csm2 [Lachnospiraceae bacterium]